MAELIAIIAGLIFWYFVWSNVRGVRKSLANIERNSARIAEKLAPQEMPEAEPAKPVSSMGSGIPLAIGVVSVFAMVILFLLNR